MRLANSPRLVLILFILILLTSVAVKLVAARHLAWEADYVPLISRGQAWIDGGEFPAVGTLSSVAAFNMPFLVWMQLPALILTDDISIVLVATQLLFNILTTIIIFKLGARLFGGICGLVAATLFTFSEVGISSAYTAWAQLLLPGFVVIFTYCLYQAHTLQRKRYVAATFVAATAAFMTHFSAVLLFGIMLVFALLFRSLANARGVLAGLALSAVLIAPYMAYEATVDFTDLRAFLSRRPTLSPEALDQYAYLKPEAQVFAPQSPNANAAAIDQATVDQESQVASTRLQRALAWLMSIPLQFVQSLRLVFQADLNSIRQDSPAVHQLYVVLRTLLEACFWFSLAHSVYTVARRCLDNLRARPADKGHYRLAWGTFREQLRAHPAGRNVFLMLIAFGISAGLILVRAGPDEQPTYYTGLIGLQFLSCAYMIHLTKAKARVQVLLILIIIAYVSLGAADRILLVANHDPSAHTPLNLNLYSSLNAAADWIADDWSGASSVTISYDVFPEMAWHWWIVAWHNVDPGYRMGMALDYLLASYHGLINANRNPVGLADRPDYIVTSKPGLLRYPSDSYQQQVFNAIYVLKPSSN